MKAFFAFFALIISFQSLACEKQATDWTADRLANPWVMDNSKSRADGYWAYKNSSRCGKVDSQKHWQFVELNGAKLEREIQNVKNFEALQAKLAKVGAKPSKFGPDKMCIKNGKFSAYAEDHYHYYENELQFKVKFMIDNGHLKMEDYKLPECPF